MDARTDQNATLWSGPEHLRTGAEDESETRTQLPGRTIVAGLLILLATVAVLWLAGEQHRHNCLTEHRVSCSVLPWDTGRTVTVRAPQPKTAGDRILQQIQKDR